MPSTPPPTIVIVEDDVPTRRFLADNLAADGYAPLPADTAARGRELIAAHGPQLAILDLGLPDRDGLELLRELRRPAPTDDEAERELAVLILSGRGAELDRVRGLEQGADDYLVKPFSYQELRARVGALLRRGATPQRAGKVRVGTLELDPLARRVTVDGAAVHVSKKEFALLRTLAAAPDRVFTREELLRDVWGFHTVVPTRTLDSHAARLRKKLNGGRKRFIVNVWGVGYRLIDA